MLFAYREIRKKIFNLDMIKLISKLLKIINLKAEKIITSL